MRTSFAAVAVLCVLACGCRRSLDRSHLPDFSEKVSSLKAGMAKSEMVELLGEPYVWGELFTGPPERPIDTGKLVGYWDGLKHLVAAEFDQEEKLLRFSAVEPPPFPPGQYQGFGLIKPK